MLFLLDIFPKKGIAFAITVWITCPGNNIHIFILLDKYLELYIVLKKTYICSEKKYVFVKKYIFVKENIYLSRKEKCICFQLLLIAIFPIFEGTGWCVQPKVQLVKERCTSWKIKKTDALFERKKICNQNCSCTKKIDWSQKDVLF